MQTKQLSIGFEASITSLVPTNEERTTEKGFWTLNSWSVIVSTFWGLHVDHCLILSNIKNEFEDIIQFLKTRFETALEETMIKFFGIVLQHDKGSIPNAPLIPQLSKCHCPGNDLPFRTRLPFSLSLSLEDCPQLFSQHLRKDESLLVKYGQIVSTLLYLSNKVRSETTFSTSLLPRDMSNPGAKHVQCALSMYPIIFNTSMETGIVAYSDSEYDRCRDSRKSRSRFVLNANGRPIYWRSQNQNTVAQSTL